MARDVVSPPDFNGDDNLLDIPQVENAPVSAATGIAAVALNMSLKWHDITVIKDGNMYRELKLEQKTIEPVRLDSVFSVAEAFERHLATAPGRLANIVIDAIANGMANEAVDPVHPGIIIQEDLLPVLARDNRLDQDMVAGRLGLDADEFTKILNGDAPVTEKLAKRIEREFLFKADQLINAQTRYDRVHNPEVPEGATIGSLIEGQLAEFGIDNESAAATLGVSLGTLEDILSGDADLDDAMIEKIADSFQLNEHVLKKLRDAKNHEVIQDRTR